MIYSSTAPNHQKRSCPVCDQEILPRKHILQCSSCKQIFHRTCVGRFTPAAYQQIGCNWKCIACIEANTTKKCSTCDASIHNNLCLSCLTESIPTPEYFTSSSPPLASDKEVNAENYDLNLEKGISFNHLNANSIRNKFDEISMLLRLNTFTAFVCTESKLELARNSVETFKIDTYTSVRHDRIREGGGTIFYFKNNVTFSKIEFSFSLPDDCEIHAYIIKIKHIRPIILVSVYNSSSVRKTDFLNALERTLASLRDFDYEKIILGDFNFNLLDKDSFTHSLFSFYKQFNLWQLIDSPTRVTEKSATLIDHIYVTNKPYFISFINTPFASSDHNLICCTRKKLRAKTGYGFINTRSFKKPR